MNCIDFTGLPWGSLQPGDRACGGSNNSFIDEINGVTLVIEDGSMRMEKSDGNRFISFGTGDCENVHHPSVRLIIRFTEPQERVSFQFSFMVPEKPNPAPAIINFYRLIGNPSETNRAQEQEFQWINDQLFDVVYDNCCDPIQEIIIRTDRSENQLDNLCWGLSYRRNSPLGQAGCFFCKYLRILFNLIRWVIIRPWVPVNK